MNAYFLVEGKTEKNLYPEWLKQLWPEITQKLDLEDVIEDDFYIFSSMGIPTIFNDIPNAIEDINNHDNIDYFFIVIDAEELSWQERVEEVEVELSKCDYNGLEVIIVVQDKCIETWCLANTKLFSSNVSNHLYGECLRHYDVKHLDPALMSRPTQAEKFNTDAQYHEYYLQQMFINKGIKYRKGNVREIGKVTYVDNLINRSQTTKHIRSFGDFVTKLNMIRGL